MASRGGIYSDKRKKEVIPQYFVKEARHHPDGFTVYKVIRRVPDPTSFDCFKESFVWKRYSDFKDLYKCLVLLHKKLFLNGKPPEFAKPKLFGRFEESVVRERQKSAEDVLNFATQHPPLCRSVAFKEFFQYLQPIDSTSEIRYLKQSPLKPSKEKKELDDSDNLLQSDQTTKSQLSHRDLELFDPFLTTKEFIECTSTDQDQNWIEQIKKAFPSSSNTNPDSPDLSYKRRELDPEELLEALKVSVSQGELENYHHQSQNTHDKKLTCNDQLGPHSSSMQPKMDLEGLYPNTNSREQHRKSSKASAYLEAVIRRNRLASESESGIAQSTGNQNVTENRNSSSALNQPARNGLTGSPIDKSAFGLPTRNSLLDLPKMFKEEGSDDESRGAYLQQAAQQISFARAAEVKLNYEESFGHYKAAINTLLQGVQGDTNESRIQAVRRKTASYLKRAEDIHSNYLKTTIDTNDLWKPDATDPNSSSPRPGIIYPIDVQRRRRDTSSPVPSIPSPRHNSKDLSCYKVLGTVGKVLLVLDTRNNESYAMKILTKSCQNRLRKGVIPTNVPFMVRLHRYYSTEHAVCLVIEHASGGRLWDQLAPYFELARTKNGIPKAENTQTKVEQLKDFKRELSSTPKKVGSYKDSEPKSFIKKQIDNQVSDKGESEEEQCSSSFLDLFMEYQTEDPSKITVSQQNMEEKRKQENEITNESHPSSISDAIESPDADSFADRLPLSTQSTSSSEPIPVQRTWSYLSWDEGSTAPPNDENEPPAVFENSSQENFGETELRFDRGTNFKKISSQGDIKLFTIDQDEYDGIEAPDVLEDDIYDSRSNDGSDSAEELDDKNNFLHELLSEQDLSAVSLLGDKTLPSNLSDDQDTEARRSSLTLSRVLDISKNSPCLSMNSSFEEDRRKSEEEKDSRNQGPVLTRVVDENGVSSIDAKTLFRTHSRTRSTASANESKLVENKEDNKQGVVLEEDERDIIDDDDDINKIHSIFVEMDIAKKQSMSYRIPESTVCRWSAEIIIAVGTLHSIAILCRDLNPNNILLTADGRIRLSYFGKWRQVERKPCDKLAVKQMYVAPEMSRVGERKTEACDWWSVGAIIYELLTGTPLYIAHPSGINSHTVLSLPDHLSPEAKSLLNGLLEYYPTQRLGYGIKGLDDLMDHPFFKDIEWDFLIEDFTSGS
uniref:ribosomal protein S6 kinase delta-1-like n=1 Tax=Styela clava TaxID=7725 RepID=UPI00193A2DD9|nr:ribosomal protein S6 kinase delta-1-like [Styela clava]